MKILEFTYTLEPGGAERFVLDLSNGLSLNNNVGVYSLLINKENNFDFYLPELSKKVEYHNLGLRKGFNPFNFFRFFFLLWREKPDVVHCHLNLIFYFIPSALVLRKIGFFYTVHNISEKEVKNRFEREVLRLCFKRGWFIPVAISNETGKSYSKVYGLKPPVLIYNGRSRPVKSDFFNGVAEQLTLLKKNSDTLIFSHVARCHPAKNQKMLVSTFTRLHDEGYNLILLMIGQDFEGEFDFKQLEKKNIFFLGTKSNVTDYLFLSDAFCLSSLYEGMPISLIEAFACGCVPVCTPVGGCKDVIQNGVTGYLSETVNEGHYYEAVLQFVNNRNAIRREDLVKYYSDNYSIEKCSSAYLDLFSSKPNAK